MTRTSARPTVVFGKPRDFISLPNFVSAATTSRNILSLSQKFPAFLMFRASAPLACKVPGCSGPSIRLNRSRAVLASLQPSSCPIQQMTARFAITRQTLLLCPQGEATQRFARVARLLNGLSSLMKGSVVPLRVVFVYSSVRSWSV